MTNERPTSITPPGVRATQARGKASIDVIGALGEVALLVAASLLLYAGSITQEMWMGACVYALGGTIVGKARGKGPSSTTVGLVSLVPGAGAAASAAKGKGVVATLAKLLPFALLAALLSGCAGNQLEEAHTQLDAVTEAAQPVGDAIRDLCIEAPKWAVLLSTSEAELGPRLEMIDALCDPAAQAFDSLVEAQAKARAALDTADACAQGDAECLAGVLELTRGALQ